MNNMNNNNTNNNTNNNNTNDNSTNDNSTNDNNETHNMNNNESDTTNSIIMDLETQKIKYKKLLIEYKQAVTNYVNYLITEGGANTSLTSIKNASFLGTSTISQINSTTLEDCQATCASTEGCSGATFNSKNSSCLLRKGDGELLGGTPDDYAIIPEGKKLLTIVDKLNDELINTNKEIQKKITLSKPLYKKQSIERREKTKELVNNFMDLIVEKKKISNMLNEYTKSGQEKEISNLNITQNYYYYILLLVVALIVIILLIMFSSSTSEENVTTIQTGGKMKNFLLNLFS